MKALLVALGLAGILFACTSTSSDAPTAKPVVLSYAPVDAAVPAAPSVTGARLESPSPARGIVNRFTHNIDFFLPAGADTTSLVPSLQLATGVSVTATEPAAAPFDFSRGPVTYHLSDGTTYTARVSVSVPSAATVNAWIGTGINLGNDLDAWPGPEGSWTGQVVAQQYFFDDYRALGFNSVRIPITWGAATHASDRLGQEGAASVVQPEFLQRVETVAGWGIDAGLTIVINAHHEDWIRTKTGASYQAQKPRFLALWTQIAQAFRDWPPQLIFEVINEPQGNMTNADVNDLNRSVLAIIRATNPTRTVLLGPNRYNAWEALVDGTFQVPPPASDAHIIATFHNYNPWSFAGESKGTWGTGRDLSQMASTLDRAAAWAQRQGVPLNMGEYGATLRYKGSKTDLASRATWYRYVFQAARSRGISVVAWDDFGDFKLYDRVKRSYDHTVVGNLVP